MENEFRVEIEALVPVAANYEGLSEEHAVFAGYNICNCYEFDRVAANTSVSIVRFHNAGNLRLIPTHVIPEVFKGHGLRPALWQELAASNTERTNGYFPVIALGSRYVRGGYRRIPYVWSTNGKIGFLPEKSFWDPFFRFAAVPFDL